ncbi:MAG TPA: chemotaxis protein CheB, partial [Polyangiaceae bacterium]
MKKSAKPRPKRHTTAKSLEPATASPAPNSRPTFPVVGLGASAGGLEALEPFLKNMPLNSGMAFVVVQHLDPTRKGILAELLQRAAVMPVVQVKDRMKAEPDHVYVIPPNMDLSILRGVLHLLEPAAPRGLRRPIDFFLRSLADDQQNQALQEMRAEVEGQLQRYTALYDFAPVGYFTLESDGAIREVNLAGAELLGAERARLVDRRFGAFVV